MPTVAEYLESRYPGDGPRSAYREYLARVIDEFLVSRLADPKYEAELMSGIDGKFWSCLSEALVYQRIKHLDLPARPKLGEGPDFLVQCGSKRVWIEVVCPEPVGVPSDWLNIQLDQAGSVPHEAILLRWTSAIKDKTDRLVGSIDGRVKGYLSTGLVSEGDVYVIAINGCQMRHGPFSALHGISQFPYAVEAVFPVGPYQIRLDPRTLKKLGEEHQMRFHIPKPNGTAVPSHAFLDPRYQHVSAIWAVDWNGASVIGNSEPSALVHNPNAIQTLKRTFLSADDEFIATKTGNYEYTLTRYGQDAG